MAKSTKNKRAKSSPKPYDGFPLTVHPSGRWCKKHQGKQYYFGKIDDWQAALARYEREWQYITTGRAIPLDNTDDRCTMRTLANEFLNAKRRKVNADELSLSSMSDYVATCERLIGQFTRERRVDDLRPLDFGPFRDELAKRYGVVMLRNEINRCRMVFKFAFDNRLIDRPVSFGQAFDRPSQKAIRQSRQASGPKMFEADELRHILDVLDGEPIMRSMVLLAMNTGFGNTDVANLPLSALDLEEGWVSFPRPKTAVERRIPLWSETVQTLREAIAKRPDAADAGNDGCVFLTKFGKRWVRVVESKKTAGRTVQMDALAQRFGKLLKMLEINGRKRLGFYSIRHVFQTVSGDAKDPDATAAIMGHVDSSMGAVYRERISDERLRAVTETVRRWLFENDGESG